MFSVDPQYYSQEGATESLPAEVRARVEALVGAATVPTSIEGQITPGNARELRALGANILVLGTQFDLAIQAAIQAVVRDHHGKDRS
jgi:pentose-5-phosphate-3-epimerase